MLIDIGPDRALEFRGKRDAQGRFSLNQPGSGNGGGPSVPEITSVTDNGDGTLTIKGSGFGGKEQAAPVLHDFVDVAYENGVENAAHASVADNESPGDDIYTSVSGVINRSFPKRGKEAGHYTDASSSAGGVLGFPQANGGNDPQQADAVQGFYGAFWFWNLAAPQFHWVLMVEDAEVLNFQFDDSDVWEKAVGEEVDIDGTPGVVLGARDSGGGLYRLELEIPGMRTSADVSELMGKNIIGQSSGASVIFPDTSSSGGDGYIRPRFKITRLWQPGGEDVRMTLAINLDGLQTGDSSAGVMSNSLKAQKWNLVEIQCLFGKDPQNEVDVVTWINGVEHARGTTDVRVNNSEVDWNPDKGVPALTSVGPPGDTVPLENVLRIAEVYQDKTRQRVFVADRGEIEEGVGVTPAHHRELQRPIAWSDTEITVEKNLDGWPGGAQYIYVVSPGGEWNTQGVQI